MRASRSVLLLSCAAVLLLAALFAASLPTSSALAFGGVAAEHSMSLQSLLGNRRYGRGEDEEDGEDGEDVAGPDEDWDSESEDGVVADGHRRGHEGKHHHKKHHRVYQVDSDPAAPADSSSSSSSGPAAAEPDTAEPEGGNNGNQGCGHKKHHRHHKGHRGHKRHYGYGYGEQDGQQP